MRQDSCKLKICNHIIIRLLLIVQVLCKTRQTNMNMSPTSQDTRTQGNIYTHLTLIVQVGCDTRILFMNLNPILRQMLGKLLYSSRASIGPGTSKPSTSYYPFIYSSKVFCMKLKVSANTGQNYLYSSGFNYGDAILNFQIL